MISRVRSSTRGRRNVITPPIEFQRGSVPFTGGVYRAYGLRVIDGDTIDLIVDVGLNVYTTERVRVAGVNTPELRDPDFLTRERALGAMAFTSERCAGKVFTVRTYKSGNEKFGRYLADIILPDGTSLAAELIAKGLGVPYTP